MGEFFIDLLYDFGRPGKALGRQKRLQKRCKTKIKKKHTKKGLRVMVSTEVFPPGRGGGPYKIPAGRQGLQVPEGSGPREWIIQAMLQETRQNLMTTPLRATGARWRIIVIIIIIIVIIIYLKPPKGGAPPPHFCSRRFCCSVRRRRRCFTEILLGNTC